MTSSPTMPQEANGPPIDASKDFYDHHECHGMTSSPTMPQEVSNECTHIDGESQHGPIMEEYSRQLSLDSLDKEPVPLLDQILLDPHADDCTEEREIQELASSRALMREQCNHDKNKKKAKPEVEVASQASLVLAQIGINPATGRPKSVWIERDRPLWVKPISKTSTCCCASFIRRRFRVPIFHPESATRLIWNFIGFLFIVFEAFLIPLYIAFDYNPTGWMMVVVSVVDIYFIADVAFSFFTGYFDETTNLASITIMQPSEIQRKYLKGWCFPDILAAIPWEWIPLQHGPVATTTKCVRFVRSARTLRVTRLVRLMRLGLLTDTMEVVIESNRLFVFALGLLRVLFLLFAITHWSACAWYMVGAASMEDGDKRNWISRFIEEANVSDADTVGTKYVYSVYFALTTMTTVGYGDITAQNFQEVQFVLALLFIASIVFAGLMGALTDLIGNLNNEANVRCERKVMLSRYMRWRDVPRDLFMSIRSHLLFLWETDEGYGEFEGLIKEQLPPSLKRDLSYHIYGGILKETPFLSWMKGHDDCLKQLAEAVVSIFLSQGDYLFRVGSINEYMYVLLKGTLYISQNQKVNLPPPAFGVEGIAVPRNKEASAIDLIKMMTEKATHTKDKIAELHEEQRSLGVLDMMQASQANDSEDNLQDQCKDFSFSFESHVDSHILHSAYKRLHKRDLKDQRYARLIQRRWRRYKSERGGISEAEKLGKWLSSAKSKYVHAPAYLGESCLWQPFHNWDDAAPRFPYSASCENRCELVYFSRVAIKDIIDHFGPWLQQRFDFFRLAVVDNIQKEASRKLAVVGNINKDQEQHVNGSAPPENPAPMAPLASPLSDIPEDLPPGRLNLEAYTAMNFGLGGTSFATPLNTRTGLAHSTRSFRAAAQAAVARVAARVTPPSHYTPGTTPRLTTPRGTPSATPRERRGITSRERVQPMSGGSIREPADSKGAGNHPADQGNLDLQEPLLLRG